MDDSEADATFTSFASSVSGIYNRRATIEKRSKKPGRAALLVAVDGYLSTPNASTASDLYRSARKLSAQSEFFAANHTSLCLQLLDTLAEHLLDVAASYKTSEVQDTQYSQLTQTQQAPEDSLQLLELCYLFTRRTAIGYPSHTLCKLLQWLVESISVSALRNSCENDTGLRLQLLVLAEMIKLSAGVRIYAKEMKKIKDFYRSLTILLNSTEDAELLVFSMAILARLVLSEPMGSKLFSEKNVDQAFALVFSVLDGSWHGTSDENMSDSPTILDRRSLLQMISVDLLCDLADRHEILELLEQYPKIASTIENCLMTINLNGEVEQVVVSAHFLSSIVQLSHVFRKMLVKSLSDQDVLYRVLQATLHPSKLAATTTARLVLKVIGDDIRSIRSLFESSADAERLNPIVAGMVRCITDTTTVVQSAEDSEALSNSDEYLHSVEVCHLLAKLSELPTIRLLCVGTISLNQSATLIQVESALFDSVEPQDLISFHPQLSIHLVSLLSSLMVDEGMAEKNKRAMNQFLQTSEVSTVLGAALFNRTNKDIVVEALMLLTQSLSGTGNKRFHALGLAEGIVGFSQRVGDASDNLISTIASLEANAEVSAKTVEKLQAEMQQMLRLQDDLKAHQDQALKDIGVKFSDQIRQKDDAIQKMQDAYEAKLREVTMQCESMGQHMNKKISSLQQRESLLQESRVKRGILEDENSELKRMVQVLEIRLEEIAQTHSVAIEEMKLREKELEELREEMATISGDYTAQGEELETAQDEARRLEDELNEQKLTNENTYKELVLLSKAHKALAVEKKSIESEVDTIRDEMANLESHNISMQSRLQEKKELADQLERKMAKLDDAATANKNALEDEREKRRAVSRDLDDLRKAHRKLESDMAMLEIQGAEQRLLVESRDEALRKREDEIRHLTNEAGKQTKLQALIHQLSSGVDNNVKINDGTSYLARDK
ncbi:Protein CIP2A [Phytophthora citrophthora]|uniref:Protein CIP2A n=1 Tax=Phytophthora citrophthora TaxID=4793 RepID=A0AAD9LKN8_9STRA|nr:Protein CIP2A [Phytophthora citrophthora]